jgi:diaminohydroxyphosphoribosylaminopyrimidine deaminase/5-amino-6-(5-phosphoribosylamino)uracil reductase
VLVDESGAQPQVLSLGYHERPGLAHAEVAALRGIADQAVGKTLYVTLEPCNHVGRTGKCTEAVIAAGIRRVVIGLRDPNPRVAGGGIERLREAGLEVTVGVAEPLCRQQNRAYLRWLATGRPQLLMKAALSLDGRLAPLPSELHQGSPQWLTSSQARQQAHVLRDGCDAILVGVGTVLADDPQLTVRLPAPGPEENRPPKQPVRVVLDGSLRTPTTAKLVGPKTLILTSQAGLAAKAAHAQALQERGVEVVALPGPSSRDVSMKRGASAHDIDLYAALRYLGQRDLLMVMCEGGATLHGALLEAGLYDEAALFLAPVLLGDGGVPLLRHFSVLDVGAAPWLQHLQVQQLGPDVLLSGLLQRGNYRPTAPEADSHADSKKET